MLQNVSNQRGETLVSVMVAAVILLVLSVLIAPSLMDTMKQGQEVTTPNSICREAAGNVLTLIRSSGSQSHYYKGTVDSKGVKLNDTKWRGGKYKFNSEGVATELAATGAFERNRWPNVKAVDWNKKTAKGMHPSHTPLLIHSSVNALTAIYNSFQNQVCTRGFQIKADNALSALHPGDQIGKYELETYIWIRPYDWSTGEIKACEYPLYIRPFANQEPPRAQELGIIDLDKFTPDRGFEVEVRVDVKPESNGQRSRDGSDQTFCTLKERFQYEPHLDEPAPPDVQANGTSFTFTNDMPIGTHMVCRASCHCFSSSNPLDRIRKMRDLSTFDPSTSITPTKGGWVPCDRLRVCDSDGKTKVQKGKASITKTFKFSNNCIANVEAKTFDIVGNISNSTPVQISRGKKRNITGDPNYERDDDGRGFEVGGLKFSDFKAAKQAAAISGLPIHNIDEVPAHLGMDKVMNEVYGGTKGSADSLGAATGALSSAQGAAAQANAALNSANSSTHSSGAFSNAATASTAASAARQAATQAKAAAAAAKANASVVSATAGGLGAVGEESLKQANAAAKEAERAALEAERLAKAAEEAARQARLRAQRLKEQEDAREDDDDNR